MSEKIKSYTVRFVVCALLPGMKEPLSELSCTEEVVKLSDHEADVQAKVAEERKRCRDEEVEPLKTALSGILSRLRDLNVWQTNLEAVEKLKERLP